jgi:ABC-type multidrug transport system fused ATPase/permease subunit
MKEGSIVETGTHEYLRKNGPEYIRLNQIILKENEELEKSFK